MTYLFLIISHLSYLHSQALHYHTITATLAYSHHENPSFFRHLPIITYVTGTIFTIIIGQWIRKNRCAQKHTTDDKRLCCSSAQ